MRFPVAPLLLLPLLACGPKPPPPPPPKDPPQVFVTFPSSNVVGASIDVSVSVVGCATVKELSLHHTTPEGVDAVVMTGLTYSATPTVMTIPANAIPYQLTGIAANLSLKARAVCDDDRKNTSSSVSATFFPVENVISKGGALVVPESFVASGLGVNTSFFGCSGGASLGSTELVRVNASGDVTQRNTGVPYACTLSTYISPLNIMSGKRWAWEANVGGYAFDADLNITGQTSEKIHALGVMPNGDAVTWNKSSLGGSLRWVSHQTGANRWASANPPVDPLGQVAGAPILRQNFGVYVPELYFELATNEAIFRVQAFNENTGATLQTYDITRWQYQTGDTPVVPSSAFNNDGTLVYLPVPLPGFQTSQVWACATTGTGCTGANLRWKSLDLPGYVTYVLPFHNGSKIAAVASNVTWFLDAATGEVLNKDGIGIQPDGQLVTIGIEANPKGTDVYLLNGAPPAAGQTNWRPLAIEVVGVESPDLGEVFRYQLDNGSITVALDDSGGVPGTGLWMRIGSDLVKPKLLGDYRAARGR